QESLVEKGALVAVHPDDREDVFQRFAEAVATATPCEMEYRIRTRDGAYRFHLARVAPIHDETGAIHGWVGVAFDMHDRRLAEQALRASERRFEAVFEANPQPMAITRLVDGRCVSVNDALLRLMELRREEVLGQSVVSLGVWTAEQRAAFTAGLD